MMAEAVHTGAHTAMMTDGMPHWQLDSIFSGLEADDFQKARADFVQQLTKLEHHLQGDNLSSDNLRLALKEHNNLLTLFSTIHAYLNGFLSTDAFNERAKAISSEMQPDVIRLQVLGKNLARLLRDEDMDSLLNDDWLQQHRYVVSLIQQNAQRLLGAEAEMLSSQLNATGASAWGRLQGELISKGTLEATIDGEQKAWNVAALFNLWNHEEREVRRQAHETSAALLDSNAVTYTAAMNSIKGQALTLSKAHGWESPLEQACHTSHISLASLEAMHAAIEESLPDFRRYYRAKADLLGFDSLTWYDLRAPISHAGATPKHYTWEEAQAFVVEQFGSYSPALAAFAQRSFDENWHDVPPRKGKRNGAFCMGVAGRQESRIMLNFGNTLDDIFTVAHELGHAYHNDCCYRLGTSSLQRGHTPMTLAETASIFCETIVVNAMLEQANQAERLLILEQDLLSAAAITVDIYARFLFERSVFEKRQERELSTQELNDLMESAQRRSYGEDFSLYNPRQWMSKPHYYSFGMHYYNYPYTFGYLFGLGVYAQYQQDPESFKQRYEKLLASTGSADAKTLAQEFGIDIEDVAFWRSSLAVSKARIDEFVQLAQPR